MNTATTYAELLKDVSVTVTPNDAAFLAALVLKYMKDENHETAYLQNLVKQLNPLVGC